MRTAILLLLLAFGLPAVLVAAPRRDDTSGRGSSASERSPGSAPSPRAGADEPAGKPPRSDGPAPRAADATGNGSRADDPPRAADATGKPPRSGERRRSGRAGKARSPGAANLPPARAVGLHWSGRLIHGRQLPERGRGYLTWDPIRKRLKNRGWRRWGTGRLLTTVRRVLARYARRHPGARPVLVGDLSRPRGGDFGPRFGGIGHASHQNGLDADIYYPRLDRRLRPPRRPEQVDRKAAQELVDAFVRAGAERVFVGPSLALRGPQAVVQPLVNHDNHLHVRLPR